MKRLVEYTLLTAVVLGIVYAAISPLVSSVAASLNASANLIEHPELAAQQR